MRLNSVKIGQPITCINYYNLISQDYYSTTSNSKKINKTQTPVLTNSQNTFIINNFAGITIIPIIINNNNNDNNQSI